MPPDKTAEDIRLLKAKFQAAKQLIQDKNYSEARTLLRSIDHPTASQWLEKLDQIAPEKTLATISSTTGDVVRLVCANPDCHAQNIYPIDLQSPEGDFTCPECHEQFYTKVHVVRSKRSRGYRKNNVRHFSIRTIDTNGGQHFTEFVRQGYEDFELRAKDLIAFSVYNGELSIVQNITIGQFMDIPKPELQTAQDTSAAQAFFILILIIAAVVYALLRQ
jgi:hypothetical protein